MFVKGSLDDSAAGAAGSDRSNAMAVTPARWARLSAVRAPATTRAPSWTSALVTARPMPLLAPVTTAILPASIRSNLGSFVAAATMAVFLLLDSFTDDMATSNP